MGKIMVSRKNWSSSPIVLLIITYSISTNQFIDALPLNVNEETQGLIHGTDNGVLCDILDLISLAPKDGVVLTTAKQLKDLFCGNGTRSALRQSLEDPPPLRSTPDEIELGSKITQTTAQSVLNASAFASGEPITVLNLDSEFTTKRSEKSSDDNASAPPFTIFQPSTTSSSITNKSNVNQSLPFDSSSEISNPENIGDNVTAVQSHTQTPGIKQSTLITSTTAPKSGVVDVIGSTTEIHEESKDSKTESSNGIEDASSEIDTKGVVVFDVNTNFTFHESANSSETNLTLEISNSSDSSEMNIHATIHLTDLTFEISESSTESTTESDVLTTTNITLEGTSTPGLGIESTPNGDAKSPDSFEENLNKDLVSTTVTDELHHTTKSTISSLETTENPLGSQQTILEVSSSSPVSTETPNEGVSTHPSVVREKQTAESATDHGIGNSNISETRSPEEVTTIISGIGSPESIPNTLATTIATYEKSTFVNLGNGSNTGIDSNTLAPTNGVHIESDSNSASESTPTDDSKSPTTLPYEDHLKITEQGSSTPTVKQVQTNNSTYQNEITTEHDSQFAETLGSTTPSSSDEREHFETTVRNDYLSEFSSKSSGTTTESSSKHEIPESTTEVKISETTGSDEIATSKTDKPGYTNADSFTTALVSETYQPYFNHKSTVNSLSSTTFSSEIFTTYSPSSNHEIQTDVTNWDMHEITDAFDTNEMYSTTEPNTSKPSQNNSASETLVVQTTFPATGNDKTAFESFETTTVERIEVERGFESITEPGHEENSNLRSTSIPMTMKTVEESSATEANEKSSKPSKRPEIISTDIPVTRHNEVSTIPTTNIDEVNSITESYNPVTDESIILAPTNTIDFEEYSFSTVPTITSSKSEASIETEDESETPFITETEQPPNKTEQTTQLEDIFETATPATFDETIEGSGAGQSIYDKHTEQSTHTSSNNMIVKDEMTTIKPQSTTQTLSITSVNDTEARLPYTKEDFSFESSTSFTQFPEEYFTEAGLYTDASSDSPSNSDDTDVVTMPSNDDQANESAVSVPDFELPNDFSTQNPHKEVKAIEVGEDPKNVTDSSTSKQMNKAELTTMPPTIKEQSITEESNRYTATEVLWTEEPEVSSEHERTTTRNSNEDKGIVDPETSTLRSVESLHDGKSTETVATVETTTTQTESIDHSDKSHTSSLEEESYAGVHDTTTKYTVSDEKTHVTSTMYGKTDSPIDTTEKLRIVEESQTKLPFPNYEVPTFDTSTVSFDQEYESSGKRDDELSTKLSTKSSLESERTTITITGRFESATNKIESDADTTPHEDLLVADYTTPVHLTEIQTESTTKSDKTYDQSAPVVFEIDQTTTATPNNTTVILSELKVETTIANESLEEKESEETELLHTTTSVEVDKSFKAPEYEAATVTDRVTTTSVEVTPRVTNTEFSDVSSNVFVSVTVLDESLASNSLPEMTTASQTHIDSQTGHITQVDFTKMTLLPVEATTKATKDDSMVTVNSNASAGTFMPFENETSDPQYTMTTEKSLPEIATSGPLGPYSAHTILPEGYHNSGVTDIDETDPRPRLFEPTTESMISETTLRNFVEISSNEESNVRLYATIPTTASIILDSTQDSVKYLRVTSDPTTLVPEVYSEIQQSSVSSNHDVTTEYSSVTHIYPSDGHSNDSTITKSSSSEITEKNFITSSTTPSEGTSLKYGSDEHIVTTSRVDINSTTPTQTPNVLGAALNVRPQIENRTISQNPDKLESKHTIGLTEPLPPIKIDQNKLDPNEQRVSHEEDLAHERAQSEAIKAIVDYQSSVISVSGLVPQNDLNDEIYRSKTQQKADKPNTKTSISKNNTQTVLNLGPEPYGIDIGSNVSFSPDTNIGPAIVIPIDPPKSEVIPDYAIVSEKTPGESNKAQDSAIDASITDLEEDGGKKNEKYNKKTSAGNKLSKKNSTQSQVTQRPKKIAPDDNSNCLTVGNVQVCVDEPIANYLDVEDE
ncbi:hypothetical protein QAD02_012255 [Eretmocerus hayati]|uniref:Uncharacterized protein n=1 Tax=Eretmocerus hayati TaxID=131215 RepID=A0ACC2P025_9HYME|nr:hypothetical protein QAD02_012255 [Eretmocerus hayati]